MGNLILVGGGLRSGKSRHAVYLAEQLGQRRVFLATAEAIDEEMRDRIRRHREERADRFHTIECPLELSDAVAAQNDCDVVLIDCLTLWLSNLLGAGYDNDTILCRVDALLTEIDRVCRPVVVVSNEVGMGLVSMNALGRRFQDLSGWAHQRLAAAATEIYLATLGCILRLKPGPLTLVSPSV